SRRTWLRSSPAPSGDADLASQSEPDAARDEGPGEEKGKEQNAEEASGGGHEEDRGNEARRSQGDPEDEGGGPEGPRSHPFALQQVHQVRQRESSHQESRSADRRRELQEIPERLGREAQLGIGGQRPGRQHDRQGRAEDRPEASHVYLTTP